LLVHWGSWLGNLTSATRTFCPRGCSHSQLVIASLWIVALSSPENRIPKININSAHICGPRNWLTCNEILNRFSKSGCNSFWNFWTSELVKGALTNPISPPLRGTSLNGEGVGLSPWDWGKDRFSMSQWHCSNSFWSQDRDGFGVGREEAGSWRG
jgi:hypothetical protein